MYVPGQKHPNVPSRQGISICQMAGSSSGMEFGRMEVMLMKKEDRIQEKEGFLQVRFLSICYLASNMS